MVVPTPAYSPFFEIVALGGREVVEVPLVADCSGLGLEDPARFFLDHAKVALGDGPPFGRGYDPFVRLNFATSRSLLEEMVLAMAASVGSKPGGPKGCS